MYHPCKSPWYNPPPPGQSVAALCPSTVNPPRPSSCQQQSPRKRWLQISLFKEIFAAIRLDSGALSLLLPLSVCSATFIQFHLFLLINCLPPLSIKMQFASLCISLPISLCSAYCVSSVNSAIKMPLSVVFALFCFATDRNRSWELGAPDVHCNNPAFYLSWWSSQGRQNCLLTCLVECSS